MGLVVVFSPLAGTSSGHVLLWRVNELSVSVMAHEVL
jgi:hypothetical protein